MCKLPPFARRGLSGRCWACLRLHVDLGMVRVLGLCVALAVGAVPATAWACKIVPAPDAFQSGSSPSGAADVPSLTLSSVTLVRAKHGPTGNGECADVGTLVLSFQAADSSAWPSNLGVRLSLEKGDFPPAFPIPPYPLATSDGSLAFAGQDDPSKPIDFTLQAVAVDSSGNESAPTEVHVSDPGRQSTGCSFSGNASGVESGYRTLLVGLSLIVFGAIQKRRLLSRP